MGGCTSKDDTASENNPAPNDKQPEARPSSQGSVRYAKNKVVPEDEEAAARADKRQRLTLPGDEEAVGAPGTTVHAAAPRGSEVLQLLAEDASSSSPAFKLPTTPMSQLLLLPLDSPDAGSSGGAPPRGGALAAPSSVARPSGEGGGFLQQLADACQQKPSSFQHFSRVLEDVSRGTAPFFQKVSRGSVTLTAGDIAHAAQGASQCLQGALAPVLAGVDRVLSGGAASGTSGTAGRVPTWQDVDLTYLLDSLDGASRAAFDVDLVALGAALLPLLEVLMALHAAAVALGHHMGTGGVPLAAFQVAAVSQLIAMLGVVFFRKVVLEDADSLQAKLRGYQLLRSRLGWRDSHLACVLDGPAKAMLVHLTQAAPAGERKINFTVSRSHAFWDAFGEASRQGVLQGVASGVCYKVFPSFLEEVAGGDRASSTSAAAGRVEAGEGHGPRKEFFAAVGADLTGQVGETGNGGTGAGGTAGPMLFVYNRSAGAYWFNTELKQSNELQAAYQFSGWLMGQSLLNKAPLAARWPAALFEAALAGPSAYRPTLPHLEAFDPAAATSLRNVAALPKAQLRDMMALEGLPADTKADEYVQRSVRELLVEAVAWQAAALRTGLLRALDLGALSSWSMSPEQLAAVVAGGADDVADADFEVQKVFRVVLDDELSGRSRSLPELLWAVLSSWPVDQRRRFLAFVTGSDRLPARGAELLRVETPFVPLGAQEHKAMLGMLPQAHTCDNLLELPNYWESLAAVRGVKSPATSLSGKPLAEFIAEVKRILEDRLLLAITNCAGYGLDQRGGGGGDSDDDDDKVPPPQRRRGAAVSESSESLRRLLAAEGPLGAVLSSQVRSPLASPKMRSPRASLCAPPNGLPVASHLAHHDAALPHLPRSAMQHLPGWSTAAQPAAAPAAVRLSSANMLRDAADEDDGGATGAGSSGGAARAMRESLSVRRRGAPAAVPRARQSGGLPGVGGAAAASRAAPPAAPRSAYADNTPASAPPTHQPSFPASALSASAASSTSHLVLPRPSAGPPRRAQATRTLDVFGSTDSLGGFSVPASGASQTSSLGERVSHSVAVPPSPRNNRHGLAAAAGPRDSIDTTDLCDVFHEFQLRG